MKPLNDYFSGCALTPHMDENTSSLIGQICQLLTTKKFKFSDKRILLQKLLNGLQNRDWLDCINENSRLCSNETDENIDLVTCPLICQANWKRLFDSVLFVLKQAPAGAKHHGTGVGAWDIPKCLDDKSLAHRFQIELNGSHDCVESFECFKIISLNALSFTDSGLSPDTFLGHALEFYKLKAIVKHKLAALNEIIIEGIFKKPFVCATLSEIRFKQTSPFVHSCRPILRIGRFVDIRGHSGRSMVDFAGY
uniref:Bromo domain-containing protein n=1 Tax=Romanomermis culicivorax TaxID=13658 RepID=A0A915HTV5_ROMCU